MERTAKTCQSKPYAWIFCSLLLLLVYLGHIDGEILDREIGVIVSIEPGVYGDTVCTRQGRYLVVRPHTLTTQVPAEIKIDKIGFRWVVDKNRGRARLYGGTY